MPENNTYTLLETVKKNSASQKLSYLFKTNEDALKFMKVFTDNWCTVEFELKQIAQDSNSISEVDLQLIERNPEARAKENLFYGFAFLVETAKLNEAQEAYVRNFLEHHIPERLSIETLFVLQDLNSDLTNEKYWISSSEEGARYIQKGYDKCQERIYDLIDKGDFG